MAVKIGTEPDAQRMTITPEMAFQILTNNNTHNRPLSRRRVNDLSREMSKGNWRYNPADAIVFDNLRVLANGQHRLEAVVDSEISQDFLVVTGAHPEAQDVMDQQKRRTVAEQLSLSGYSDSKHLATISRIHIMWSEGNITNQMKRPSTLDVRHWVENAYPEAMSFAIASGVGVAKISPLNVGPVGAAAYSAYLKDSGAAEQFFHDMTEGIGLDKGHPVLTLTKYLQRQSQLGTRFREHHQLWLVVSTWNSWRQGRTLGKIMSPSEFKNDIFPRMK